MKMIFIFIDGLGLGDKDPAKNPIYAAKAENIIKLIEGRDMIQTDATLGISGLPQSATGQTTIFTGVNASAALGRHLNGQPTETLIKIINEGNLFEKLISNGFSVTNCNVYRDTYIQSLYTEIKDRRLRPSVTTVMCMACKMELRNLDCYRRGKGIYHDITGKIIRESGFDVETISPAEAAQRLYNVSRGYDFTLYEHFMTDIIGHKMDMGLSVNHIRLLDEFLGELLRIMDFSRDTLLITSDHGNIEDATVKTHTYNKVPTVIMGPGEGKPQIKSLLDITPAVLEMFGVE